MDAKPNCGATLPANGQQDATPGAMGVAGRKSPYCLPPSIIYFCSPFFFCRSRLFNYSQLIPFPTSLNLLIVSLLIFALSLSAHVRNSFFPPTSSQQNWGNKNRRGLGLSYEGKISFQKEKKDCNLTAWIIPYARYFVGSQPKAKNQTCRGLD